jgi:hypothetical protein
MGPEENVARCYKGLQHWSPTTGWRVFADAIATAPPPPAGHVVAGETCDCGFYAYFDTKSNPHYFDPADAYFWGVGDDVDDERQVTHTVFAVVQGYGVITVASRGFRCSKMRVRAIVEPPVSHMWPAVARYFEDLQARIGLARARYADVPVLPLDAALSRWPLTPVERAAS